MSSRCLAGFGVALMVLSASVASLATQNTSLFPIMRGGRFGFIDVTGRVVIEPQFDETRGLESGPTFLEGLHPIKVGEDWGYVDTKGQIAIPPRFSSASSFSDGLAKVRLMTEGAAHQKKLLFGYIGHRGEFVIPPAYEDAKDFSEGVAYVRIDKTFGYIDKKGHMVIDPRFDSWSSCSSFTEGLACIRENDLYGFIDKKGKIVIPPQFSTVSGFADGLAVARRPGHFQPSGYIDREGKFVIPDKFLHAYPFHESLARVQISTHTAFIDKSGRVVFELDGDYWADAFSDGLTKVKFRDKATSAETIGYVDRSGNTAIPPRFLNGTSFARGLAYVTECGRSGYINRSGEAVWGLARTAKRDSLPPQLALVTPAAIERATGHPGPLKIEPVPAPPHCTEFGKAVWKLRIYADDASFNEASVSLLEGETFLTPELRERYDRLIADGEQRGHGASDVLRTVLPGTSGQKGYSVVLAFGPGGSLHSTIIPSPDGAFEVLVLLSQSLGDGPRASENAKEYQSRMRSEPTGITDAIATGVYHALFPAR